MKLSMQYSAIPFDSHEPSLLPNWNKTGMNSLTSICATQVGLCQKITIHSDISSTLMEGLNHYTVVYGLNCRRLKDSVAGHWNMQWKKWRVASTMFIILVLVQKSQRLAELISTPQKHHPALSEDYNELGLCYKCGRPHFQNNCTNHESNNSNKFQNKKLHMAQLKGKQLQTKILQQ